VYISYQEPGPYLYPSLGTHMASEYTVKFPEEMHSLDSQKQSTKLLWPRLPCSSTGQRGSDKMLAAPLTKCPLPGEKEKKGP
jgi:hypothetical protein